MANAKVRIDVPTGVVELEGDEKFVTTYLDKLLPFIEAGGFGTVANREEAATDAKKSRPAAQNKERKRIAPKRPPSGTSCRDRILALRQDGFFKDKQSVSTIVDGLAKKGWTHTVNQVGAALKTAFDKGEIQRTKDGKAFKYFYDRDA